MADCETGSKIACEVRCLDAAAVDAASRRLKPSGIERVAYTCKLSGKQETVLLIGDELAAEVRKSIPGADTSNGAKVLAGLYGSELCECDVATLTGVADAEAVAQLRRFEDLGMVSYRRIHGMNYYRLTSEIARRYFDDAVSRL